MLTESTTLQIFEEHGIPQNGISINFLPSDRLLETLTQRFNIEFAVMFDRHSNSHFIYGGDHNSIALPYGENEILLKHTHPKGTPHPSCDDISWLKLCQSLGSVQKKSIILPIGHYRIKFYNYTHCLN